jgi:hypothetical protein
VAIVVSIAEIAAIPMVVAIVAPEIHHIKPSTKYPKRSSLLSLYLYALMRSFRFFSSA